ncbi:MAG: amidase [Actinomycetota bacterium]
MGQLTQTARRIGEGSSTSEREVRDALDRAAGSKLNAFTLIAHEEAIEQARQSDKRNASGALRGAPIVMKDLFDVHGWPTTACSHLYDGRIATTDSQAVAALRSAGAIIIGKTNMHELAFGATGDTSSFEPTNNPWDLTRMTGGSSSGSAAAVAARIVGLGLGTDTGGSVRIPASLCGVSALKTTYGLVSIEGVVPLSISLDTVGPIAQDVEDLALAMSALCDTRTQNLEMLSGVTIGLAGNGSFDTIDNEIETGVREAIRELEKLGAAIVDVSLPDSERARDTWTDIALPEYLQAHDPIEESKLSEELRFITKAARFVTEEQHEQARAAMQESRLAWTRAFEYVELVAMPATPITAPKHFARSAMINGVETPVHGGLLSSKTRQINVAGVPALCVPCGFDASGLPFGMQLVGSHNTEAFLLSVGILYQRATDWHLRQPSS